MRIKGLRTTLLLKEKTDAECRELAGHYYRRARRAEKERDQLRAECESLRKDAERYRYIKGGNQWIVAATQTGTQLDGEDLDDLIDREIGQQK